MEDEKKTYWDLMIHIGDPLLRTEYCKFLADQKSLIMQSLINFYYGIIFVGFLLHAIIVTEQEDHNNFEYDSSFIVSILILISCGCAAICSCLFFFINFTDNSISLYLRYFLEHIESFFILSVSILQSLQLIRRVITGDCNDNSFPRNWDCNPYNSVNALPMDTVISVMLVPLTFSSLMRESRLEWTLISWIISIAGLIVSTILINSTQPIVSICYYACASLFIIFDLYRQNTTTFFLNRQLQATLTENQKLAQEQKATEMRHMIANVAHDLKTPLSSLTTGIDIITKELTDCSKKLDNGTLDIRSLSSVIETIQSCLKNIQTTNDFMLMTINRCLDYTKASKGIKLTPKNETIDLAETLKLPLNCMLNIQNKISITVEPIAKEICAFIITDKQWLQENILCLLSNAVKYSSHGNVTISVSLHDTDVFRKGKTHIATPKEQVDIPIVKRLKNQEKRLTGATALLDHRTSRLTSRILPFMDYHATTHLHRNTYHNNGSIDLSSDNNNEISGNIIDDKEILPPSQLVKQNIPFEDTNASFSSSIKSGRRSRSHSITTATNTATNANTTANAAVEPLPPARRFWFGSSPIAITARNSGTNANGNVTPAQRPSNVSINSSGRGSEVEGMSYHYKDPEVKSALMKQQQQLRLQQLQRPSAGTTNLFEATTLAASPTIGVTRKQIIESKEEEPESEQQPANKKKEVVNNNKGKEKEATHCILFEIEDSGIGLSDEAMLSLFNPFKQTQRLAGGTGLGLYSLAKRVESLNGLYGVKKRRDGKKGSLFWFTIPYRPDIVMARCTNAANNNNNNKNNANHHPLRDSVIFSHNTTGSYDSGDETVNSNTMMVMPFKSSPSSLQLGTTTATTTTNSNNNGFDPIRAGMVLISDLPSHAMSIRKVLSLSNDDKTSVTPSKINNTTNTTANQEEEASLHVLMAEDSHTIAKMTSMMLKRQGYHVTIAENGEIALKYVMDSFMEGSNGTNSSNNGGHVMKYDVILMDLQMPVMDGLEATRRLRQFEREHNTNNSNNKMFPHIPVIGVSANSDHETMQEAYDAGIDAFISKPFAIETFSHTAAALIARL